MKSIYSGLEKPPTAGMIKALGMGDGQVGYEETLDGNYRCHASSAAIVLIVVSSRSGESQTASTRSP